jgi:hypothetical protein
MSVPWRLFNCGDPGAGQLYPSHKSMDAIRLAELTSGNKLSVEYTLLTRNQSGSRSEPWERITPGNYSLKIGLFKTSDRTLLAQSTGGDFTDDAGNALKRGLFLLDTAAIDTALAAVNELACTLEIEVTDSGGPRNTFRGALTLKKTHITATMGSVPSTERPASQEWVKNVMMPRDGTSDQTPLAEWYVLSYPSGFKFRVFVDDEGRLNAERLET